MQKLTPVISGYPIGVYKVSRPLEGSAKTASQNYSRIHRRDRAKTAIGMPIPRDGLAMTLARRSRVRRSVHPEEAN